MTIDPALETTLRALTARFLEENAKLNLSALRTEDACWTGNILDSLALLEILPQFDKHASVLDVGTGGGFPLLPLALALPQTRFTGMDAVQKKVAAVQRIASDLGISNVTLVAGRTEELGQSPEHRERYDLVLARAVAPLATLLEYVSPFCAVGGSMVLWKSLHIDEEMQASLSARTTLSAHLVLTHRYVLPGDWGERQLLVFRKAAALSGDYPRPVGTAKKNPL